jgi:glycosyltransferase involved in cell wall biosynthesis
MDFGNSARRYAFDQAVGLYVLQIDDDDWYADDKVFETLQRVTKTWAAFPVLAYGKRCHRKPPALYLTGSAMFMYRRDTGCRFPDNADYSADGQLVEELKSKYEYETLDDCRELVIYPTANHGRTQAEIDTWRPKTRTMKYAADGLTVDWHDMFQRG